MQTIKHLTHLWIQTPVKIKGSVYQQRYLLQSYTSLWPRRTGILSWEAQFKSRVLLLFLLVPLDPLLAGVTWILQLDHRWMLASCQSSESTSSTWSMSMARRDVTEIPLELLTRAHILPLRAFVPCFRSQEQATVFESRSDRIVEGAGEVSERRVWDHARKSLISFLAGWPWPWW